MGQFVKINLVIVALGLVSLAYFLYQVHEVYRVGHWSKTDAVVSVSKTVAYDVMVQTRVGGTRFHKRQDLIFCFAYTNAGRPYVSKHFCWVGDSALDAVWDYPAGFHFTALYNPVNPRDAVVEPGHSNPFFLVISTILLAVGAIGLRQCTSI